MKGKIDHTNYEDYFLLYVDDELNEEDRAAVELFLVQYPALKPVLESLQQTKLPADDTIKFADKSKLFFKHFISDETILLFLDKEPLDDKTVQHLQNPSPELRQRMDLLRKTIVTPDLSVVFSKKDELYRSAKVVSLTHWKIVAAAAVLILAVGYGMLKEYQKPPHTADLAQGKPEMPLTHTGDTNGAVKEDTIDASIVPDQEPEVKPVPSVSATGVKQPVLKNTPEGKEKKQSGILQNTIVSDKPSGPRKPAAVPELQTVPVIAQQPVPVAKTVEPPAQSIRPSEDLAKTVTDEKPAKEKKSLFKKLTKRIEEKVYGTFNDGDGQVTVAGFAFNLK